MKLSELIAVLQGLAGRQDVGPDAEVFFVTRAGFRRVDGVDVPAKNHVVWLKED